MSASTLTTMAHIYKRMYSDRQVANLAMRDHPFMSSCAKRAKFGGDSFSYPVGYGNPQGVAGSFAAAQANATSSKGEKFVAARFTKYGIITVDGEALAASEGNDAAFLSLVTNETDGILNEVGDSLAFDIQRAGNGDRGQRLSAATNVITLSAQDDVRNFKVGMTVVASANLDGSSARSGSTTVAAIDQVNSTITLTSAAAITSFANSDYLFRSGDIGTVCEGLEALFPLTAPVYLTDSFRGVDRGVDTDRLAGVRLNDTASSIEENAGRVAVMIASNGQRANCLYLNPIRFWEVIRRLNAKVEYDKAGGSATYGFQYFMIETPAGTLKCYSDPDVPTNRGRVLNMETLYIKHLREFIHVIRDDGKPSLRQTAADGLESRVRSFHNVICDSPGSNGVFAI